MNHYLMLSLMLQFSHLIDENTGSKFDMIGSNAVSNKDNSRKCAVSYCALWSGFLKQMLSGAGLMSWMAVLKLRANEQTGYC